jgi:hypothetical protein
MSKEQIAEISASVDIGSPTGLRFALTVDTFPSVTAFIAPVKGNEDVQAPVSGEVIARLGKLQQQRLAGRTSPDFHVTAHDGLGGSIECDGFISAPLLEWSKVSTYDRISAVGEAAMVDALGLSIYSAGYSLEREESGNGRAPIAAASSGDVAKVLSEVTDVLVANYGLALAAESSPGARELMSIQHGVNTSGPLKIWKKMLEDSNIEYTSWGPAIAASPAIARQLAERTRDFLEAQSSGFWSHVQSLMASFNMFYVPSFNGVGHFERADKKVDDPEVTIAASVTRLSLVDGSSRILAPGGVVMMGRSTPTEREESQPDPDVPRIMAHAPSPLQAGFIHREPIPFWLAREEGIPIFGSEIDQKAADSSATSGKVNLDLAKRAASKQRGHEYKAKVGTVSEGVMTEVCEVIFKKIQLEQSTVGLSLPLEFNLSDHIGKRITVKLRSGAFGDGGQFTAFVHGVTHNVDLQQGKQLNSSSEVQLTHADYR